MKTFRFKIFPALGHMGVASGQHSMYLSSECVTVLHGSSGKATWLLPAAALSPAHSEERWLHVLPLSHPSEHNTSMLY